MTSRIPDPNWGPDDSAAKAGGDAPWSAEAARSAEQQTTTPAENAADLEDFFSPVAPAEAPADWSSFAGAAPKSDAFAVAWQDEVHDWGSDFWAPDPAGAENGPPAFTAGPPTGGQESESDPFLAASFGPAAAAASRDDFWDDAAALSPADLSAPVGGLGGLDGADPFLAELSPPLSAASARRAAGRPQPAKPIPANQGRKNNRFTALVPAWGWAMIGGAVLTVGGAVGGSLLATGSLSPRDAAATNTTGTNTTGTLITQPTDVPALSTPIPAVTPTPLVSPGAATPAPTGTAPAPLPTGGANPATAGAVTPLPGTPTETKVPAVPLPASPKPPSPTKTSGPTTAPAPVVPVAPTQPAGDPDAIAPPEVAVAGPPSGLAVTAEDRNFGSCPAKFSAKVTVEVAYGVPTSATAKFTVEGSNATGSADLAQSGYNTFSGILSGMPTKKTVFLQVTVKGPDGSTQNEPFQITHSC